LGVATPGGAVTDASIGRDAGTSDDDAAPRAAERDAGRADIPPGGEPSAQLDAGVSAPVPNDDEPSAGPVPGGAHVDAGSPASAPLLTTLSLGCEPLAGSELCLSEGWMLARGESIPACGSSGAYRICTFEGGACISHTVMMVQCCK